MPQQRVSQESDSVSITNDKELNAGNTFNDVAGSIYNNAHSKINDVVKNVTDVYRNIFNKLIVSWKNTCSSDFKNNPEASNNLYEWWCNSEYTTSDAGKPIIKRLAEIMHIEERTARGYVMENEESRKLPTIWAAENLKYFLEEQTGSLETYYDIVNGQGAYRKAKELERKQPYIDSILDAINQESLQELNEDQLKLLSKGLCEISTIE